SDYPNQVNNVLCFPFIFRGALDVGATTINEEMKLAATRAIAALAEAEQSDVVASAYGVQDRFGPEHLIPRPFDPRLISRVAPAVAQAAMESGVATQPIADMRAYREHLEGTVYRSGEAMQPVFAAAAGSESRIVFADGEDERVLRALQVIVDERLAKPIVVGRADVIAQRATELGLRIKPDRDFAVAPLGAAEPDDVEEYLKLGRRHGVTSARADLEVRRSATVRAALMVRRGQADGMLCGLTASYAMQMERIKLVIGHRPGCSVFGAMNILMVPQLVAICDTQVNEDPTAEQLAEISRLAAAEMRRFGLTPRIAMLSHSSFGSANSASARKMRKAAELLSEREPSLEVEGEIQGDAALSPQVLERLFSGARLKDIANLLVMPTLDAANIAFTCLRVASSQGVTVGPILLGGAKPAHILLPTSTVRGIVNMTALTSVEASMQSA
ncbi:MAG: NADP-dependent malic enzyme, partial [Acetobacteraceae bacterium]|nr:NADP-dependent malic enzyme [Acetobacteraceae bacterium]